MKTLHIDVADKVASYHKEDGSIICGNADYQIEFAFDEEWSAHETKTARFIIGGVPVEVDFTGNICAVPIVSRVYEITVGVYVENALATTKAVIPCTLSILCDKAKNVFKVPEPEEWDGSFELLVSTVSGVWVFNETLPLFEANETVKFTSNSEDYNGITLYDTGADGLQVLYKHGADDHTVTYEFDSWVTDAFRTVDFGTTAQEVSEEFYTWLTANAVKQ